MKMYKKDISELEKPSQVNTNTPSEVLGKLY